MKDNDLLLRDKDILLKDKGILLKDNDLLLKDTFVDLFDENKEKKKRIWKIRTKMKKE